jgi:hypothetical protein
MVVQVYLIAISIKKLPSYFVDANGQAWVGNIVISGDGLVWQTGSDSYPN